MRLFSQNYPNRNTHTYRVVYEQVAVFHVIKKFSAMEPEGSSSPHLQSLPLDPILGQLNSVYIPTVQFSKILLFTSFYRKVYFCFII